jgi:two-component sensor histidine kinase
MTQKGEAPPVVEPRPDERSPDVTLSALLQRIRQQEMLAELGVKALQGATFDELLTETARLTARGLRADYCKVLEYLPAEKRLLVRAGVGWEPGIVGVATVGADTESPAGFALRTGKAVISNHLENEERFRTPEILASHGVKRAMNVILQGDGKPFGVLEVDSRSDDDFVEHDLAFLQGAANILGMAIERERYERTLKTAVERHEVLLQEINHRVKNSLALVTSMLRLQAREDDDPKLAERLAEAATRVNAVARAHERLYQGDDVRTLDLGVYVRQVCMDLDEAVSHLDVQIDAGTGIILSTDRAISAALIVAELVTNAAKYAYDGTDKGKVWVRVARADGSDNAQLTVRDEGAGLPADFDFRKGNSLGMRIISAFTQQLGGAVTMNRLSPGTEFAVTIPINPQT